MRLLFVKDSLSWPRSSGHDVHCFHMMQALTRLGHEVGLLTAADPLPEAVAGLPLSFQRTFPKRGEPADGPVPNYRWLQRKFQGYWGIDENRVRCVGQSALDMGADGVVVVGLNVLPYLGAVKGKLRVWYAADEWAWHHTSQVRLFQRHTWGEFKQALVKGLYERAYRSMLDRVWVVTNADRRAMRLVAGVRGIDVVPNGVDAEHFKPQDVPQRERSCTFWGRLDFGPNVQALEWFCGKVWPRVRAAHPDATFTVYGFSPTPAVRALVGRDGIELIPDLPDLRPAVASHQVVVFPFVSGGGIKNKFLEAAAMGKPIVCSSVALNGLRSPSESGTRLAKSPEDWAGALSELWSDAGKRAAAGTAARAWVVRHHSWDTAARTASEGLEQSLAVLKK
ncbi:D-inositol-3-phosphate glycosyltransferase [Gemmata obscuriglobus]|nr:glycosyltransferase [Gemmata obscuriglobus]QEG32458.1 D-inositol-3-phosphate glycosyltransferase [Gemmata obscuriglobus]VTS11814.1 Sugar transferase, PEP-CTERM/EpsH1 system associated OS=Singulisphaera acidiphila (strain ATCC BAA-1392 / DSM 18658 / VKM B-2454 / MOB10) GN=Sinac_5460 PE=4 SV=1: Glyco_trans_1_4 [Gemmata obscuriglobus UQM 2246]